MDKRPYIMSAKSKDVVDKFIERKNKQGHFRVVERPTILKTKSGDVHILKYETGER